MDNQRRFYIDPATGEFLFMRWDNGWVPSMEPMRQQRAGALRIYTLEPQHTLITMPHHERWTILYEDDESAIRQSLEHPWILDGQATEGLREDQIDEFDAAARAAAVNHTGNGEFDAAAYNNGDQGGPMSELLDTLLRPTLFMDAPLRVVPVTLSSYHQALAAATAASLAARQPSAPPALPPAMPRHIADLVLAKAEADGQTCPITMEPIRRNTASITSCGHIFQTAAIREWLQTRYTCPDCRQPCRV